MLRIVGLAGCLTASGCCIPWPWVDDPTDTVTTGATDGPSPSPTTDGSTEDSATEPPVEVRTESFAVTTNDVVDVLWVIDSSHSMACVGGCHTNQHLDDLVDSFPAFLAVLDDADFDYHIGVITTDVDNPAFQGQLVHGLGAAWIDAATSDPQGTFRSMVSGVGWPGSGREAGLAATFLALDLHADGANAGFSRSDAALRTIVYTNEDDQSPDVDAPDGGFADWYGGLRPAADRSFDTWACVDGRSEFCAEETPLYEAVTEAVGGLALSIEDEDPVAQMTQLAQGALGTQSTFVLTEQPRADSIEVGLTPSGGTATLLSREEACDPATGGDDWVYVAKDNVVALCAVPAPWSTVDVTYEVDVD